jgi:hypothetical protein
MATSISSAICRDNLDNGVANILSVYAQATPREVRMGVEWYSTARAEAVRISDLYGVPVETVVKVACALSPRLAWESNMVAAEKVIRWYVSGGYVPDIRPYADKEIRLQRTRHNMTSRVIADDASIPTVAGPTRVNIVKALWLLQGHAWVLRGKKVASFLDNILNCQTSLAVTCDSHAIQVWRGLMEAGTYSVPPSWYAVVEADYRTAARLIGLTPLQLQAITWLVKKRLSTKRRRKADTKAIMAAIAEYLA